MSIRTTRRRRGGSLRVMAGAMVVGAMLLTSGCTVIAGQQARTAAESQLAQTIAKTQEAVWDYRDALAADVDGAVDAILENDIAPITDARRVAGGDAIEMSPGRAALLTAEASSQSSVLTFAVVGSATAGDYLTHTARTEGLCFALRIPVDEALLLTDDAACPSGGELRLAGDAGESQPADLVALARLDVRTTVSASDFRPSPCQCSSGSPCECPGG